MELEHRLALGQNSVSGIAWAHGREERNPSRVGTEGQKDFY